MADQPRHLSTGDVRWMAAALALSQRGRGRTAPNPCVGCVIVREGRIVGRGWTQPGGRPHAEAMALAEAGAAAIGATVYTTLEPCAHVSTRGPACSGLLIDSGVARVVVALGDPDPRTDGLGAKLLRDAGIAVTEGVLAAEARRAMAGFLTRQALGRPLVTLKLAMSLDARIALASGESRWITGPDARAHAHLERARHEAILVGRGTWLADSPRLDVRLAGLEDRSPRRVLLSSTGPTPPGWTRIADLDHIRKLADVDHLFVEGGAQVASAMLRGDLVDRLLIYRAPVLLGSGRPAIDGFGPSTLAAVHGRWRLADARMLGSDRFEDYERVRS